MNSTLERMRSANAQALREVNAEIDSVEAASTGDVRSSRLPETRLEAASTIIQMTPRAILAWFFCWTLCASGFFVAMSVAAALTRLLKILIK